MHLHTNPNLPRQSPVKPPQNIHFRPLNVASQQSAIEKCNANLKIFVPTNYKDIDTPNSSTTGLSQSRCLGELVKYNKLVTGGNDPRISKVAQFSSYVQNSRTQKMPLAEYLALVQNTTV